MSRCVNIYEIHPFNHEHFTTMIIDGTKGLALDDKYFIELIEKRHCIEPYDSLCWHMLATGEELMKLYACQEEIIKILEEDAIYIVERDV